MLKVFSTKLYAYMFDCLEKAGDYAIIIFQRHNREIERLTLEQPVDWREHMTHTPHLLIAPEELCQPLDDLWEVNV